MGRLIGLLLALALAGSTSLAAAAPADDLDPRLLQPKFVDVGYGRRLHFACIGQGSPTVVFEQGGEGAITNWRKVQPAITALTRTCFYDRAGFGFSDTPRRPVTAMSVTDDLRTALRGAKLAGPIVLVGHSIGGFYATMYADRFPDQVAGMVLVDPGFAGQDLDWRLWRPSNLQQEVHARGCEALARKGELTRDAPHGCFAVDASLRRDEADYLLAAFTRPAWYEAELSLVTNYFPLDERESVDWREERQARRAFGGMPLIVLTAAAEYRDPSLDDAAYALWAAHWRAGHIQLAARSLDGEEILVPNSHHFIQLDQPQAVIDAIRKVVSEVRQRGR